MVLGAICLTPTFFTSVDIGWRLSRAESLPPTFSRVASVLHLVLGYQGKVEE